MAVRQLKQSDETGEDATFDDATKYDGAFGSQTLTKSPLARWVVISALAFVLTACATTTEGNSVGLVPTAQTAAIAASSGAAGSAGTGGSTVGSGPPGSGGGRSGTIGPDGAEHPCSLLTQAEAESLAGTPLMAGIENGTGDTKTLCQYIGPTTGPLAQVQIFVGDGAKKMLDIDRDVLKHPFTTLTGIGDEAYQEDDSAFVRKGEIWASIELARLNDPAQNVRPMQSAVRELASRLG
jgi:hypothetical protein